MKKSNLLILACTAMLAFATPQVSAAPAATGPWTARVRATYLSMANTSDAFTALGINFPADAVSINSKLIPEFDFAYNFTPNFSTELVLTIPQTQDVTLKGVGKLGTFKHLPPVLSAQYQFCPGAAVQPYVGAGVNLTLIYDTKLSVANIPLALDNKSIGLAAQAGCDFDIGNAMYINVDVKKVMLRSDVSIKGGAKLTTAKLDPWLFSVGLGWRF